MINILEASNFISQNNNLKTKSSAFIKSNKQTFSKIFNNEKQNLLLNNQNKTKNFKKQINNSNSADKPCNKLESKTTNNKTSSEKTKQLKEYKDMNIDETAYDDDTIKENEEELIDEEIISSLQSILAMLENILSLENINNGEKTEINMDQIQDIDSLKEQLVSLLQSADIPLDESFKQNIETTIKLINKINDKQLPISEEQIIIPQQNTNEQTINIKVIEDQIIQPKQFISEIAQKVSTLILKDKSEMNIQLTPKNLGKLSIKIGLNEGSLTGKIYAENYSVKETIEANLDQLKDSLEEQGLNIAGLEVHINDNSQNFEKNLYQSTFTNRQKSKTDFIEVDSNIITLEQNINEVNPYLTTNQFDSLV